MNEFSYLGVFIARSRLFKCPLNDSKKSFYRAANAVFGKVGKTASEKVTLQLVMSKCVFFLLYGLEACPLNASDIRSLYFVINQFLMQLFKTADIEIIKYCQNIFRFELPSVRLSRLKTRF